MKSNGSENKSDLEGVKRELEILIRSEDPHPSEDPTSLRVTLNVGKQKVTIDSVNYSGAEPQEAPIVGIRKNSGHLVGKLFNNGKPKVISPEMNRLTYSEPKPIKPAKKPIALRYSGAKRLKQSREENEAPPVIKLTEMIDVPTIAPTEEPVDQWIAIDGKMLKRKTKKPKKSTKKKSKPNPKQKKDRSLFKKANWKRLALILMLTTIVAVVLGAALYLAMTFLSDAPKVEKSIMGTGKNTLNQPSDIVVVDDQTYVIDSKNKEIKIFNKEGQYVDAIRDKSFEYPYSITADEEENLYVSDYKTGSISIYSTEGAYEGNFDTGEVKLTHPGGIRIIQEKMVITDVTENKVYAFSMEGELLKTIEGKYDGKELKEPQAVAGDEENLYISDNGHNRILKFDKEGNYEATVHVFDDDSHTPDLRGLAVDNGVLYVADRQNSTVYGIDENGDVKFKLPGLLNSSDIGNPNGVYISEGKLYISNILKNNIAVYTLPNG